MKRFLILIITLFFMIPSVAQEKSCFPVGSATHDSECYGFEKKECQKTDDIYSCAWGKRSVNHVPDDEQLICEDHRCKDAIDDEEDFAEE